jgi:RimJ/RimL family protein N-acetyltransferase
MPVELTSQRLLLRPPGLDDGEQLYQAAVESVDLVGRWLPWCHAQYDRSEGRAWIEACLAAWHREESYPFFIFDRRDRQLLGGCGLNEIDRLRLRANLGYWVRSSRMGQGVATAAARMVARFGLETLCMQRLEIVAAVDNSVSQRVAEKLGAMREGRLRNRLRIRDIPHDAFVYSLIPSDLRRWPRLEGS